VDVEGEELNSLPQWIEASIFLAFQSRSVNACNIGKITSLWNVTKNQSLEVG
jgi:hypothetical protein